MICLLAFFLLFSFFFAFAFFAHLFAVVSSFIYLVPFLLLLFCLFFLARTVLARSLGLERDWGYIGPD
jgi:hypothetical protein